MKPIALLRIKEYSMTKNKRKFLLFFKILFILVLLTKENNISAQTYCTPAFSFSACAFGNDFWITSVNFGTLSGSETGCIAAGSALRAQTGSVTAGSTYTLTVTKQANTYSCTMQVWADWDNDGVFNNNANEYLLNQTNAAGGSNTYSANITVPAGANIGTCRIRVEVNYLTGGGADGCSQGANMQGEFLDYNISVLPGTPCSGTPASLSVSPASPTICSGSTQNISLAVDASGYTYQWQESNALAGTYSNVTGGSGATGASFTSPTGSALPYNPTFYRCNVTCTSSGITTASQISTADISPFINCYCKPSYTTGAAGTDRILRVKLNGTPALDNTTALGTSPWYRLYTSTVSAMDISTSYNLTVYYGTNLNSRAVAYIDFNQDGVFNTTAVASGGEFLGTFATGNKSVTPGVIAFTVPATALSGTTMMRIIESRAAIAGPCSALARGEVQDYYVSINAGCTSPSTQATNFVTDPSPTTTTCSVKFTRGNGDGGMLVVCKAGSVPSAPTPGTVYASPNADITAGGSITGAGSYVIYNSNSGSSGTQVTVPAINLTPNTTYYFAAYEWNSTGNCYELTSPANGTCFMPFCLPPTVQPVSDCGSSSTSVALINWAIGNGNAGEIVFLKVGSDITTDPTDGTIYNANTVFGLGDQIGATGAYAVFKGTGGSTSISNLLPNTTYYYRVYTFNSAGPCYLTPTTSFGNFTSATCSPTVQPSNPQIKCIENTSINLFFDRGNGDKVLVLMHTGADVNSDPVFNASYLVGDELGVGNYVVYNGNDAGNVAVPINGLTGATTYYFKMYEYNSFSNCYNVISPASVNAATLGGLYSSATATQNSTNITAGALDQDIIKLTIVTSGDVNQAVVLNNIVFNTTGTSSVANLTNAKIFYTGISNTFSNATQFGATFTTFGTLTATDNFTLLAGNNYFWVAYDIKSSAAGSTNFDAQIVSINVTDYTGTSTKTLNLNPAGVRNIPAPGGVCPITIPDPRNASSGCNTACCQGENISNITFGTTTATAGYGCTSASGYDDKTATNIFTVSEGITYTMNESDNQWFSIGYEWCVWIDWNNNGDLRDAGERYPSGTATISTYSSSSQNITIPIGVMPGNHLMRIWYQEASFPPDDCPYRTTRAPLSTGLGQVIDITLVVDDASGVPVVPPADPVSCATTVPIITTPVTYTQGDVAIPLTATGTDLLWYTSPTGGVGSSTAPTPSTATTGTTTYYVSQTNTVGSPTCESPRTQIAVIVNSLTLSAPVASVATQPTCLIPTGSVDLSGLPASGTWTIVPGLETGSGTTYTLASVTTGTYSYQYVNSVGCISASSNSITINPTSVATPTLGTIIQPTCSVATGSIELTNLPASGIWTINPGGISGSGTSFTIPGVSTGIYSYSVTDDLGCVSQFTNNAAIYSQPATPATPTVAVIQPYCTETTGTIVLSALSTTDPWIINPGTYTGCGSSKTLTSVSVGTYSYTVTNSYGCTSLPTAPVSITLPLTPSLSGTRNINGTGDYPTFQSAIDSLTYYGLAGPIIFEILDKPYTEKLVFPAVCGASSTNTITFKTFCDVCAMGEIQATGTAAANYTVKLAAAGYYIFDRIKFVPLNSTYSRTVDISNSSHDLVFRNCIFNGISTAGNSVINVLVYSDVASIYNIEFSNNIFKNGTQAIYLKGNSSTDLMTGITISNNTFKNQSYRGVTLINNDLPIISGNNLTSTSVRTDFAGLYLQTVKNNTQIDNNTIYAATASGRGIFLDNFLGTVGNQGNIFNNMICIGNASPSYDIDIVSTTGSSEYFNLYFNSFYNNSATGFALRINVANNLNIKNNIFKSNSATSYSVTSLTSSTENYNDFMPNFAGKGANSIAVEPSFLSTSDLHTQVSGLNDAGISIAGITLDIDDEIRDATPYIGADEFFDEVVWTGAFDTDWNNVANWSPGLKSTVAHVPTKGTIVTIPLSPVRQPLLNSSVSNTAECREITVLSDMEIPAGKYLTVYKSFTNSANFTLKSNATGTGSFIPLGTYTNTGTTKMELYLSMKKWHYLSSPITTTAVIPATSFYYWDETVKDRWYLNNFVDWNDGVTKNSIMGWTKATGTMSVGKGYAFYNSPATKTHVFSGDFNNGNITVDLDYTNHGADPTQDLYNGWNLVGNPYPSTLNWNSDGIIKNAAVDNAICVYVDDGTGNFSNYKYYMKGSTGSPYPSIALNASDARCFVAPGQSVMIRANAGGAQVTMTNEAREHTATSFYKSAEVHPDLLRLSVEYNGLTDESIIRFISEASAGYDGQFDAIKRYPTITNVPQLYSVTKICALAVNTLPKIQDGLVINLGLTASKSGKYIIASAESNFSEEVNVYLIDKYLQKRVNLTTDLSYSFDSESGNFDNRFQILFKINPDFNNEQLPEDLSSEVDILTKENVKIINYENILTVYTENIKTGSVLEIQDVLGKNILKNILIDDKTQISTSGFASGTYFVRVITENYTYSKKIFIR